MGNSRAQAQLMPQPSSGSCILLYKIHYAILWVAIDTYDTLSRSWPKDGGMSILPWSFAKRRFYIFKNSHKINILGNEN